MYESCCLCQEEMNGGLSMTLPSISEDDEDEEDEDETEPLSPSNQSPPPHSAIKTTVNPPTPQSSSPPEVTPRSVSGSRSSERYSFAGQLKSVSTKNLIKLSITLDDKCI